MIYNPNTVYVNTVAPVRGNQPDRCYAVILSEFLVLSAKNFFMM